MVDKKACKVRKRKYKINGAIFFTRLSFLFVILAISFTIYTKANSDNSKIVESSAYIDENGISSLVKGVENGAVYTEGVEPKVSNSVKKVTLTKDGKEIKYRDGKKISDMGSYILKVENKNGSVDTIYFDIEY